MMKKKERIDYKVYIMNGRERVTCIGKTLCMLGLVSYLFYSSFLSFIFLLPYMYIALKKEKERLCQKRLEQLRVEFREGIQALLSALDTGYSVENAFQEACKDLKMIYPEDTYITIEFRRIVQGIRMNKPVEGLLHDLGERSGLEEIQNFAEIFSIAKRSGGDLLMIIRSTVQTIRERIEVRNEIQTMISGKRLEQRLMNIVPFGILAYVRLTSGGLLDVMYGNFTGVLIMSLCLLVYLFAAGIAEKIVDVEV